MPGEWQEKLWGRKRELSRDDHTLIEELEVSSGGYCSIHHHCCRLNTFLPLDGVLTVESSGRTHHLFPGQSLVVREMNTHQFSARRGPVRLIEVSQAIGHEPLNEADIFRISEGGIAQPNRDLAA